MHSSIICSANPLLFNCTSTGLPFLFNIILASFELKSIHPLSMDLSCKLLAHFSNRNKRSLHCRIQLKHLDHFQAMHSLSHTCSVDPNVSDLEQWYTMCIFLLYQYAFYKLAYTVSTFGFNEQIPFDNSNGSIGTTRSAK